MKCQQCGSIIPESAKQCPKCQSDLSRIGSSSISRVPSSPPTDSGFETVPPWRREVAKKVRAYGERKKKLITPANPLQDSGDSLPEASAVEPVVIPREPPPKPPIVTQRAAAPPNSPFASPPQPVQVPLRAETWKKSVEQQEETETDPASALLLRRRAAALTLDSFLVLLLYSSFLYVGYRLLELDLRTFLFASWKPVLQILFLTHFLYYLYFYTTSRQTPGQVFNALELKDPFSSQIGLGKIVIRWLSLVVLNVLNLLPLLMQRNYLLLDRLSGTQIRSLK